MPAKKSLMLVLMTAAALAACTGPRVKLEKCHKPQEYQQATIGPMVAIPEGLKPLDPALVLEIPYGPANTSVTSADKPCLVEPPSYLDRNSN